MTCITFPVLSSTRVPNEYYEKVHFRFHLICVNFYCIVKLNSTSILQLFATSVENKAVGLKRQQRKQNILIYKMLPKIVVEQLKSGETVAETFDSATLFFSTVVDFKLIASECSALEVLNWKAPSIVIDPVKTTQP